jgi:uncharacterized membrane protein
MFRNNNASGCWWVLIIVSLILTSILSLVIFVPYSNQKGWVDSLAGDGDLESYTLGAYNTIQIVGIVLAVLAIIVGALLLIYRNKSQIILADLSNWLKQSVHNRWRESQELRTVLLPGRDDLFPLGVLAIITVFGIFFRYAYLWRPMGHDETYTFIAFASRGLRVAVTDYHLPNNHVFHTILVNLFYQMLGDSPAVIRLTAFIAGVLIIPATYLVSRIFYDWKLGLVAASIVSALPVMVDYSTTARGYTIITLFALIIVAIAAYVKDHRNLIAWFLLMLVSSLGFYTNPTMIYPIGMAFTWLFLSGLVKDFQAGYGRSYYLYILVSGAGIIITAGFLYLPIIISSGISSVAGNEVVEALPWTDFTQSLLPRIRNTWQEWNRDLHPILTWVALIGLVASFFVPKLPKNRRVPLIISGFLWIATALVLQRVAPWPRIWLFLLPFFVIWIAAGVAGLLNLLFIRSPHSQSVQTPLIVILIIAPMLAGVMRTYPQFTEKLHAKGEVEQVADFLKGYLQPDDVVVVTSPDTVVLKYYLMRNDVEKEVTELRKGKEVSRSIVVVNTAHGQTIEYVLDRRSFLDDVRIASAEEIYRSRRFELFLLEGK